MKTGGSRKAKDVDRCRYAEIENARLSRFPSFSSSSSSRIRAVASRYRRADPWTGITIGREPVEGYFRLNSMKSFERGFFEMFKIVIRMWDTMRELLRNLIGPLSVANSFEEAHIVYRNNSWHEPPARPQATRQLRYTRIKTNVANSLRAAVA